MSGDTSGPSLTGGNAIETVVIGLEFAGSTRGTNGVGSEGEVGLYIVAGLASGRRLACAAQV